MCKKSTTGDVNYAPESSSGGDIDWGTAIEAVPCNTTKTIDLFETLYVRYKDPNFPTIVVLPQGDWIDLKIDEDINLKAGEYKTVSLGVAMKLPTGYEAWVVPRSSTFKKFGILQANSMGIIDSSYCGNDDIWRFPAYATRDIHVDKGTRLCQFRLIPTMEYMRPMNMAYHFDPSTDIVVTTDLGTENRGGLGSTGI